MKITFREFKDSDYLTYKKLNKIYRFDCKKQNDSGYLSRIEKNGYLVGSPVNKSFWKKVIFSRCALINGKVVGITRVEEMTSKMENPKSKLTWLGSLSLKKKFLNEKGRLIGVVLVDPKYKRKGIAKLLFQEIETHAKKNKCEDLFSWIVTKPFNKPSFMFHQKLGFKIVAIYDAKESFGIFDYQSKLFYKQIK